MKKFLTLVSPAPVTFRATVNSRRKQKKMSEFSDILTFFDDGKGILFVSFGRHLEVIYRSGRFINLLLDLALLGGCHSLVLWDHEDGEEAEDQQNDCQCPGGFFKEVSCFSNAHVLVG